MKRFLVLLAIVLPLPFFLLIYMYMNRKDHLNTEELGFKWKNFTIDEVDTTRNGATKEQLKNCDFAITHMLQPLRDIYGKPVHVNSGIRDYVPEGGSPTSYHKDGFAFDIEGWNYLNSENIKLAKLLVNSNIPFTELIVEFGGNWIHVAYNGEDKKKILASFKNPQGKIFYKTLTKSDVEKM